MPFFSHVYSFRQLAQPIFSEAVSEVLRLSEKSLGLCKSLAAVIWRLSPPNDIFLNRRFD